MTRRAWHVGLWRRLDRAAFGRHCVTALAAMGLLLAMLLVFYIAACNPQALR